jgi:hypothetical protein
MTAFAQYIDSHLQTKKIIFLGVGLVIAYSTMVLLTMYLLYQYHGNFNDYIFNVNFYYTSESFYQSLSRLNWQLIKLYPFIVFIDFIVIIFYTAFGILFTRKLLYAIHPANKFAWLAYGFLVAALFNLIEDVLLIYLFSNYPDQLPKLVTIANFFTTGKLLLGIFAIVIYILIAISLIYKHSIKS